MRRPIWFIGLLSLMTLSLFFAAPAMASGMLQKNEEARIEWLTFEQALERNTDAPRMIFIDFYTDWCSWCKKMDANTFSNPVIATLMTKGFHAVKFNAEEDLEIEFQGRTYSLNKEGRRPSHELAAALATHNERLGYPTFVVLDESLEKVQVFQGYKTVEAMRQILDYYGDKDKYTNMNWFQYIQGRQSRTE